MNEFRCAGDIVFTGAELIPGQISGVHLETSLTTCNFLQCLRPLTPQHPYFCVHIRRAASWSKITVGIAGPGLALNAQPGHWISSVGYHSDTGRCYTAHQCLANTHGSQLGRGDMLGVLVTYFGEKKSTVVFLKNGFPVATRFLSESQHSHYLPTLTLEKGPIDLELMWPETVVHVPTLSEQNILQWICPPSVRYDVMSKSFVHCGHGNVKKELTIQSSQPLCQVCQHFEVILNEQPGPFVALAGCSPFVPHSVSSLAQDYIRFDLDSNQTSSLVGHRIGIGINYSPELRDRPGFNPNAEQLVYCYVTADLEVISGQVIMQPEGGFYPVIIFPPGVSRVAVGIETSSRPSGLTQLLDSSFRKELAQTNKEIIAALKTSEVKESMLRMSKDVEVTITTECCKLHLSRDIAGVHVVQFTRPLTEDSNYFLVCIRSLNTDSAVGVGVAGRGFPLKKFPGKFTPSVGWLSEDGRLYRNSRCDGNLSGDRFYEGDIVGVEINSFASNMSVALFTKNFSPVGTVYYTQPNRAEYLPTIALCSSGCDVVVEVFWQHTMRGTPALSVTNLEHWCLPPGSTVDHRTNTVHVKDHQIPVSIQAPYSLNKGYNHFEVCLTKQFSSTCPPPAIILSTATPLDPPPKSCLKLDFLRFWQLEEDSSLVQVGDIVGWGLSYIDETLAQVEEQLVICYLTVNRRILLARAVFQPPGGFYPLIVLPPGLNEVALEFGATVIKQNPITSEDVDILVNEARELMNKEKTILERGGDPFSELAATDLFITLLSDDVDGVYSKRINRIEHMVPDAIAETSRNTNSIVTKVTESPFYDKKFRITPSIKLYADHKNSVSCTVL